MKQTAVQWLLDNLIVEPWAEEHFKYNSECWDKALEIEKEQIEKTFVDVTKATLQNLGIKCTFQDIIDFKKIAEVYYNEEFKNTNS